jgi:hypothetical protein
MKKTNENAQKIKDILDQTGQGFCLAKWTQVTMHLGSGDNHSCHHPKVHNVSPEELAENPSALHNSNYKKQVRKEMLNGERPSECDYCWRIEDNTKQFSDRVYKSMEPWSLVDLEKIKAMTGDENVFPRYVEISFSNVCNFKCSYCGPQYSSTWGQEIDEHGPYMFPSGTDFNATNSTQKPEREDNPYITAFWKWFPEAVTHMHTFRITGGEPLMSKHTMRVLDFLLENPYPELEFSINTNGNPPGNVFKEFTDKVQPLLDNKCIKTFMLYTSAESYGKQAEFSRTGLNWDMFVENINYFLNNTQRTQLVFMCAFNILSLPTFKPFLEFVNDLKHKYNGNQTADWLEDLGFPETNNNRSQRDPNSPDVRVGIDTPYVRHPAFLDAQILTSDLAENFLLPAVDYMYKNKVSHDWQGNCGFEEFECQKFKRIVIDIMSTLSKSTGTSLENELQTHPKIGSKRADFYAWAKQYKTRRGLDLLDHIPEFEYFLDVCKLEAVTLANNVGGLYIKEITDE